MDPKESALQPAGETGRFLLVCFCTSTIISGQITIIPKSELSGFRKDSLTVWLQHLWWVQWTGFPYQTTISGDQPAGKVVIICPDNINLTWSTKNTVSLNYLFLSCPHRFQVFETFVFKNLNTKIAPYFLSMHSSLSLSIRGRTFSSHPRTAEFVKVLWSLKKSPRFPNGKSQCQNSILLKFWAKHWHSMTVTFT